MAGERFPQLLGPNNWPVKVVFDLRSYWATTYHQVRKELHSRYPKHTWPEGPTTAQVPVEDVLAEVVIRRFTEFVSAEGAAAWA